MGINLELAKRAEKIAKKLARQAGFPEGAMELFFPEAYTQIREEDRREDPRQLERPKGKP